MARRKPVLRMAPDGLPEPLRWRPVVEWGGILFGILVGLGGLLLLQQLGGTSVTLGAILTTVALGVLLGIAVPSLGRLYGVARANRTLRRMRRERTVPA